MSLYLQWRRRSPNRLIRFWPHRIGAARTGSAKTNQQLPPPRRLVLSWRQERGCETRTIWPPASMCTNLHGGFRDNHSRTAGAHGARVSNRLSEATIMPTGKGSVSKFCWNWTFWSTVRNAPKAWLARRIKMPLLKPDQFTSNVARTSCPISNPRNRRGTQWSSSTFTVSGLFPEGAARQFRQQLELARASHQESHLEKSPLNPPRSNGRKGFLAARAYHEKQVPRPIGPGLSP